jgi:hypothetical protein
MHLRGLAGMRVFGSLDNALEYTTQIVMKAGLSVRLESPCQFVQRHGQCRFMLGLQSEAGIEPIKQHKLLVAWDVIHPDGATVAYAQIT